MRRFHHEAGGYPYIADSNKDQENARLHAQIRDLEKQNTLIQQFGTVSASAAAVPRANLGMLDPPWADEIEHFTASMPVLYLSSS